MNNLSGFSLLFLAGTAIALALPATFFTSAALSAFLCALLAVRLRRTSLAGRLVLAAFLLSGCARTLWVSGQFQSLQAMYPAGCKGSFRVLVDSDPELIFDRTPGGHETGRTDTGYLPCVQKVRARVRVTALDGREVEPFSAQATFRMSVRFPGSVLTYGDILQVRGQLSAPLPALNPGSFDYAAYLKAKGTAYTLQVQPGQWRMQEKDGGTSFWRAAFSLRRALEERACRLWPHPASDLFLGLVLGEDSGLGQDLVEDFAVTGTVHILAVSGANTALVTALLFLSLRVMGLKRKGAAALTLVGLGLFAFMTGAPPSVCRAALWAALFLTGFLLERAANLGVLVLSSAALLAAFNPFTLTDLSFQLSYLAALGLVVFTPWWFERMKKLWRPLSETLSATLGAQMGVWVWMAAKFNLFAVYSVPANLVVAPLVAAGTAAGVLAIVASFLGDGPGRILAASAEIPLDLLPLSTRWMARWPAASLVVATPPPAWTVIYHVLLGIFFLAFWPRTVPEAPSAEWSARDVRWARLRRWTLHSWVVFLALSILVGAAAMSRPGKFRLTVLAVGHGDAFVAEDPSGQVFVVDGGRRRDGPARWNPVVAFLRHEGVRRVTALLNTHPDADHVGGLSQVLDTFPVGRAYQGRGVQAPFLSYVLFQKALAAKDVPLLEVGRGEMLEILQGVEVRVEHPSAGFNPLKHMDNNRSLVVRLTIQGGGTPLFFLMPGDLETEGWESYSKTNPGTVDVLMASHHGRESGQPAFAQRLLKPRWVVASDSKAHPEIGVGALGPVQVLSTAETGAIQFEVDSKGKLSVSTFLKGPVGGEEDSD